MIEMYRVSMAYQKGLNALEDLSFKVAKGEFALLTGPSGAGKTTLLKLITCQERATSGQIIVNGRNAAKIRDSGIPALRRDTGMVFQDFKLLNNKTVLENVGLPLDICGMGTREVNHRAWNLLNRVGLKEKVKKFPLQLSGGEQQRVAIARALVGKPPILLADEPTGNLDRENSEIILDLIKSAHEEGTTVLLATHDKEIIKNHPFQTISLQAGRMLSVC